MKPTRWVVRNLGCGLTVLSLGACDFIEPVSANPNAIPDATLDQLLIGTTVKSFRLSGWGGLGGLWLQQLDGISRQRVAGAHYNVDEFFFSGLFLMAYEGAGLIDIRRGIAEAAGRRTYAGILKVYEASFIAATASMYGDIPYSEAVNPDITVPVLDAQRDVHDAVLILLDEAVADMQSGEGIPPTVTDLAFGGDLGAWVAVANTLKARYHLHWAEVDGSSRYTAALASANQGILDASRDWVADFSNAVSEQNGWHFITLDDLVAGEFLVEALKARSDPRLPFYFGEGTGPYTGDFVGSHPNDPTDPATDASELACGINFPGPAGCPLGRGYASEDWDFPILTCAENYFIMAEAEYNVGTEAGARAALDAALACEEVRKDMDLSATRVTVAGLSGTALFDEIMMQKYFSLFLTNEIWNDYKRTCLPAITTFGGLQIPGRLFYPQQEREANPNIPSAAEQSASDPHGRPGGANANDPNPCP
jgi:hypothetical protein